MRCTNLLVLLILAILSFGKRNSKDRWIAFSMNEMCRRYANSNSGRYSRDILRLLESLKQIHVRITWMEEFLFCFRVLL